MAGLDFFKQKIKEVLPWLFPDKSTNIRIIASSSIDSVIACCFLIKTFYSLNYRFSCSIYKKINSQIITELAKENSGFLIFVNPDLESGELNRIKKQAIIIESHSKELSNAVKTISPEMFESDTRVPASVFAYLLCKEIFLGISELSYLLLIPYLDNGLIPEEVITEAVLTKQIEVKKGLTLLSSKTMPIHQSISNTLMPYLPGISGSEDGAVQLLLENNIPIRENSKFRSLIDLNEDETKRLLTAILLKRLGSEKNPNLVLGQTFVLTSEDDASFIKDLKGFQFLIESCLAYSKPSIAIDVCLNPREKSKALEFVNSARSGLVSAMEFYLQNKKSLTIESEKIALVNIGANLDYKLLNLFSKMIINANFLAEKIICAVTITPLGEILCQFEPNSKDTRDFVNGISKKISGMLNIGEQTTLLIPADKEEEFVNLIKGGEIKNEKA